MWQPGLLHHSAAYWHLLVHPTLLVSGYFQLQVERVRSDPVRNTVFWTCRSTFIACPCPPSITLTSVKRVWAYKLTTIWRMPHLWGCRYIMFYSVLGTKVCCRGGSSTSSTSFRIAMNVANWSWMVMIRKLVQNMKLKSETTFPMHLKYLYTTCLLRM